MFVPEGEGLELRKPALLIVGLIFSCFPIYEYYFLLSIVHLKKIGVIEVKSVFNYVCNLLIFRYV